MSGCQDLGRKRREIDMAIKGYMKEPRDRTGMSIDCCGCRNLHMVQLHRAHTHTHTQNMCKVGELLIKSVDYAIVSFLVVILYYSYT